MFKRLFEWSGNVVIVSLLIIFSVLVFFNVAGKNSRNGIPKLGSYHLMVVLSGSMSPRFNTGDIIIVSADKKSQYSKGDVITFVDTPDSKKIVTHRIMEVLKNGKGLSYRTKGDANNVPDPNSVSSENIIGQQLWHVPYFGRFVEFTKTKQGLFWLIIFPGITVILYELRNIVKNFEGGGR